LVDPRQLSLTPHTDSRHPSQGPVSAALPREQAAMHGRDGDKAAPDGVTELARRGRIALRSLPGHASRQAAAEACGDLKSPPSPGETYAASRCSPFISLPLCGSIVPSRLGGVRPSRSLGRAPWLQCRGNLPPQAGIARSPFHRPLVVVPSGARKAARRVSKRVTHSLVGPGAPRMLGRVFLSRSTTVSFAPSPRDRDVGGVTRPRTAS